jgi:predicted RNA-binding protein Jag
MYEPNAEPREFVAESREEAVAKACAFFGVDEPALVVKEPRIGDVYGLGARTLIVAFVEGTRGGRRAERAPERGGEREGGRRERRERRGERGRGGDRGRRERRGEEDVRAETEAQPLEDEVPDEPSTATIQGEIAPVGEYLVGIVERMGLGPFEVRQSDEGDFTIYELSGRAAIKLGTGDGRAIDALQLLANQAAMRISDEPPRIVVDAEADVERREEFLSRLAGRAARRALDSGRSVALDPMNARDRRMVHVALRDEEGVATMSIGSGRYRQVVVVPEGSPDYEEALRASEAASRAS